MATSEQTIIDFVYNWRVKNGIHQDVVLTPAQTELFVRDLQLQLANVSVRPTDPDGIRTFSPDAKPIPYSGKMGDLLAWQLAEAASKSSNGQYFFIGDTDAGRLLNSEKFALSVVEAVGGADTDFGKAEMFRIFNGTWDANNVRSPHVFSNVVSLNDFMSHSMMVETATGDIRTMTAFSAKDSVYSLTELPALLGKVKVTSIEGVPRESLVLFRDALVSSGMNEVSALGAVRNMLSLGSRVELGEISYAVNGDNRPIWVDMARFSGDAAAGTPKPGSPTWSTLGDASGTPSAEYMGSLHELARGVEHAGINVKYWGYIEGSGKLLGSVGGLVVAVSFVDMAYQANKLWENGDQAGAGKLAAEWAGGNIGGLVLGAGAFPVAAGVLAPLAVGAVGIGSAVLGTILTTLLAAHVGYEGGAALTGSIWDYVASVFNSSQSFRRDPLVFDLDNDGLETVGPLQSGVLFDHDASGIKTSTGWIKADDGFLVMDRNANNTIDNGRELFGDATPLDAGGAAADGFAALAQEDSNGDGKVDSNDLNWSKLQVWRDLNQDGVSQSNELSTMADAGIASINVAKKANSDTLNNGNQVADLGSYVRTDGASGTMGATGHMADINLAQDTFHSKFTDRIPVDDDVKSLPTVPGSGLVRELRQAASLDGATGNVLRTKLAAFAAASSGAEQKALIDDLLLAWANTSSLIASMRDRLPGQVDVVWSNAAEQNRWESKLHVLEAFNGRYFFSLPGEVQAGALTGLALSAAGADGRRTATVDMADAQQDQLQQGYDALKESVYGSLALQTRFKPLLDTVKVNIEGGEARFDFSQATAALEARVAANAVAGLTDWIEFARHARSTFAGTGHDSLKALEGAVRDGLATSDAIKGANIQLLGASDDASAGTSADDVLFGGAGDDALSGAAGTDVLAGGSGNDTLAGGRGNDVYTFNLGDGWDTIEEYFNEGIDRLWLGVGMDASRTEVARVAMNLVLSFNAADKVTIADYFDQNRVEQISFMDGTKWDYGDVVGKAVYNGTADADDLRGIHGYANRINGMGGNDNLTGADKGDSLSGGAGDDMLWGNEGNDTLAGGTGTDTLNGRGGDDTYMFNLGDGEDTVEEFDSGVNSDKLQFGAGIAPGDITLGRYAYNHLTLGVNGTSDKVTLTDYFHSSPDYRIETIAFADGTIWDVAAVAGKPANGTADADALRGIPGYANRINGMGGNDELYGADKGDGLSGGAGDDVLRGYEGNDTLEGGTGNDVLDGGAGDDTYVFNLGDGKDKVDDFGSGVNSDKLQFGAGIAPGDITLSRYAGNMTFHVNGGDAITLTNYLHPESSSDYRVESIAFADGTSWDVAHVIGIPVIGTPGYDFIQGIDGYTNRINGMGGDDYLVGADKGDILSGGEGNDMLQAEGGNDTLEGGAGDDELYGWTGDDTYVFNLGDGKDIVKDYDSDVNSDKLQFGAGIAPGDITLGRYNSHLTLGVNGTSDKVTLTDYFYSYPDYRIETIAFADGTIWDVAAVIGKLPSRMVGADYQYRLEGDSQRGISISAPVEDGDHEAGCNQGATIEMITLTGQRSVFESVI